MRKVYKEIIVCLIFVMLTGLSCLFQQSGEKVYASDTIFSDGFENGFSNWIADSGTPAASTVRQHSGGNSYALDEEKDVIRHMMGAATNKVAVVWFYDDTSASSLRTLAFVDYNQSASAIGLGVDTTINDANYVYRIGSNYTVSSVARTTGWHSFAYDYRSGTGVELYIDGTEIAASSAATSFTRISLGDSWSGGVSAGVYFDDIRVQDWIPGITGALFSDSFEAGFANWEVAKGTVTAATGVAYQGNSSYALDEDQDAIQRKMAGKVNQSVEVWLYDDAEDPSVRAFALVNPNTSGASIGLGVDTVTSSVYYTYRIGSVFTATSIERTTGWHSFVFDYRSGTGVTLYIDGAEVQSTMAQTYFNIIQLGDFWSDGKTGRLFFDNVNVGDCLPWEEYTSTSPTDPSIGKAMGFEEEGAWNSTAYFLEDNPTFEESDLLEARTTSLEALNSGVTLSTVHVQEGDYAGKWADHPYFPTISTRLVPTDWSASNTVSVSVYSEVRTDESVSMIVYSDNPSTYWKEFYYYTFPVDWTGWKTLDVPLAAFTAYGQPAGWNQVQQLSFTTKAFFHEPNPYTVLYLDAIHLRSESEDTISQLMADLPQPETMVDYMTKYPAGFESVSLDDYLLYVNNKIEYETADTVRRDEINAENDAILAKYGLGEDTYTLDQFVDTMQRIPAGHDMAPFDLTEMNNSFPELRDTPSNPIQYEAYWKNERALYGYYPHFNSAPVSVAPDGHPYLLYGDSIIETYNADKDRWYYLDLEPVYKKFLTQTLGASWAQYRHKDDNFYEDVKIRFDNDGDAYLLSTVTKEDGSSIVGLLLYSRDHMKTWQVYLLPKAFSKFENIDTFNTDAMERPPVITLHDEWTHHGQDQGGYLLIPEKQADGTLALPTPVRFCESCIPTAAYHSGDANIAVTAGDKVYLVYGVTDLAHSPEIPADAPANDLSWVYKGKTYSSHDGTPTFIVSYDLNSRGVSDPVFVGYGGHTLDAHNWPALTMDSTGHLHVFINGHHDPTFYTSSANSYDISEWNAPELVGNGNTYASVVIDKEDTLYVITRNSEDGYNFNLDLTRKKSGGSWEPTTALVKRFKPFYEVWQQKLTIDPDTGKLFLSYFGQSRQVQIFKDEYDAQMYIWPDREKITNPDGQNTPTGTYTTPGKEYKDLNPTPSEMVTLVSADGGDTWHLSQSGDYVNSRTPADIVDSMKDSVDAFETSGDINSVFAAELRYRLTIIDVLVNQGAAQQAIAYMDDLVAHINDLSVRQQGLISLSAVNVLQVRVNAFIQRLS